MKKAINLGSIFIVALALIALVFRMCVIKIEPGETGVLTKEWGGGLQKQDYKPGFYLNLGPLHTWNVMDTTVQTLNMLRETEQKSGNRGSSRYSGYSSSFTSVNPPLRVKSSDGADVILDITVKYRILDGRAWQVFQKQGAGDGYKIRVASRTKNTLISGLGHLRTEDFFDPSKRQSMQSGMVAELKADLEKIDVLLVDILIRDLEFQQSFQAKIKAKTLTKQRAEVQVAKTKAAEAEGETNRIRAETTAKVAVIRENLAKSLTEMRAENDKKIKRVVADYEKYVAETRSTAELYAKQKEAEGLLLVKDSEARGEALRRQALVGTGGNTLVALRVVENLKLGDLSVSTQLINPLDLDRMMRSFGVEPQSK
ncbi:MAG: hypothetical protein KDC87_17645 [Planctomycetes bacterium]|nr:hypothetical protein [Planctomycetota bacterium]MCB9872280.1 hypothetical protein [Planctomycetota bacterium]